jgi:hypothetical protein
MYRNLIQISLLNRVRFGAVGWGTALKAGSTPSGVIGVILNVPAALGPWVQLSLWQ